MTAGQRTLAIQARFTDNVSSLDSQRMCEICADVAQVSGAGIMMMSGDIQRGSLCTTNKVSARIEELQFSLSEGPCLDAFHQDPRLLGGRLQQRFTGSVLGVDIPPVLVVAEPKYAER